MTGPFAGLTVVEIGQFVVVPFASLQLAQGGARVIKVEPPEGDVYRRNHPVVANEGRHYLVKNRGKESIALRIGSPGAEEVLHRLFAQADVVVTNMSPQALIRHRLDYDSVREINPSVIYGTAVRVRARGSRGAASRDGRGGPGKVRTLVRPRR